MLLICVFILTITLVFIAFAFCIKPARRGRISMKEFEEALIAHRGLFNNDNIPENSIAAFKNAVANHFGIELDLQLSKDGKIVVFHDDTLDRMCGISGNLKQYDYEELSMMNLLDTECAIPLFEDVLVVVNSDTPMVIEIKPGRDSVECVRKTMELLESFDGTYCIESFDSRVLLWLRKHHPEITRGQLATNYFKDKLKVGLMTKVILSNLLANVISRPDFIAYNVLHTDDFSFSLCRKLFSPICAGWTIRSEDALIEACKTYQIVIFDSFLARR